MKITEHTIPNNPVDIPIVTEIPIKRITRNRKRSPNAGEIETDKNELKAVIKTTKLNANGITDSLFASTGNVSSLLN